VRAGLDLLEQVKPLEKIILRGRCGQTQQLWNI